MLDKQRPKNMHHLWRSLNFSRKCGSESFLVSMLNNCFPTPFFPLPSLSQETSENDFLHFPTSFSITLWALCGYSINFAWQEPGWGLTGLAKIIERRAWTRFQDTWDEPSLSSFWRGIILEYNEYTQRVYKNPTSTSLFDQTRCTYNMFWSYQMF